MMNQQIALCKQALNSFAADNQLFATVSGTRVEHGFLVAVNYMPIIVYSSNLYYGYLSGKNASYSFTYKKSFGKSAAGLAYPALRRKIYDWNAISANLQKVKNITEVDVKLNEFTKLLEYAQNIASTVSDDSIAALALLEVSEQTVDMAIDITEKALLHIFSSGDQVEDVAAYAALVNLDGSINGSENEKYLADFPFKVEYITELHMINILTPEYQFYASEYTEGRTATKYLEHMLLANFELTHLFGVKQTQSTGIFDINRMIATLPEFRPVVMKFTDIFHPLLDKLTEDITNNTPAVLATLQQIYPMLFKYMETIPNRCTISGRVFNSSSSGYDSRDPSTYNMSRIYYMLCCLFDEIYNPNRNRPIVPDTFGRALKYTPDLAAALILRMLNDAFQTGDMQTDLSFSSKIATIHYGAAGVVSAEIETMQYTLLSNSDASSKVRKMSISQYYIFRAVLENISRGSNISAEEVEAAIVISSELYNNMIGTVLSKVGGIYD